MIALLQRAQQLGLQAHVHFGDFVEQQRAAVGLLELADAARHRAGEGALLVAEQLRFQQRLGNGRAVDGDERLARARRALVDVAGDHLLAGAALAGDQDGGVGGGDAGGELDDARHRPRRDRSARSGRRSPPPAPPRSCRDRAAAGCIPWRRPGSRPPRRGRRCRRRTPPPAARCAPAPAAAISSPMSMATSAIKQVGALAGPQHLEGLLDVEGVRHRRAAIHGDLGRRVELALQRSDDEKAHGAGLPLSCCSSVVIPWRCENPDGSCSISRLAGRRLAWCPLSVRP